MQKTAVLIGLLLSLVQPFWLAGQANPVRHQVLVSITNKAGYPPEVELRERLQVTADKQLAKIVSVEPASDLPVHIAILIDRSGRTQTYKHQEDEQARAFLTRFVRNERDKPFMLDFAGGQPSLTSVRDYADFQAAISRRSNLSGGNVLNALKSYVGELESSFGEKFPARRSAVIFSNGGATIGKDFLPQLRQYALSNRLTVFILDTDWTWRIHGFEQISTGINRELAEDTGGTWDEPHSTGQYTDALNRVGAVIRNQYVVTFETQKADSKLHSLEVRALDPSLVLHAPRYFVRSD